MAHSQPPSSALACDDPRLHERVVALARALSADLMDAYNRTKYDVHGLFGIFAEADTVKAGPKAGKLHNINYQGTKTAFMLTRLCQRSRVAEVRTVCEVGFCAGLSAILLLEAAPGATIRSFDLGDLPWSRTADSLIRDAYPTSRFPGVVFGDAKR